jgi:hypothetical protein
MILWFEESGVKKKKNKSVLGSPVCLGSLPSAAPRCRVVCYPTLNGSRILNGQGSGLVPLV